MPLLYKKFKRILRKSSDDDLLLEQQWDILQRIEDAGLELPCTACGDPGCDYKCLPEPVGPTPPEDVPEDFDPDEDDWI
jgi:hypothetical protein